MLLKAGKVSETPKGVSDCFNPCFSGLASATTVVILKHPQAGRVSILVLVD